MVNEWILVGGLLVLLYLVVDLRRTNKKVDEIWDELFYGEDDL